MKGRSKKRGAEGGACQPACLNPRPSLSFFLSSSLSPSVAHFLLLSLRTRQVSARGLGWCDTCSTLLHHTCYFQHHLPSSTLFYSTPFPLRQFSYILKSPQPAHCDNALDLTFLPESESSKKSMQSCHKTPQETKWRTHRLVDENAGKGVVGWGC